MKMMKIEDNDKETLENLCNKIFKPFFANVQVFGSGHKAWRLLLYLTAVLYCGCKYVASWFYREERNGLNCIRRGRR